MNATTKLRIATYLRRLADRLNPPASTLTYTYSTRNVVVSAPRYGTTAGFTTYGSPTTQA